MRRGVSFHYSPTAAPRRAGPLQFAEICETNCPTSTPLSSWPLLPKKFATDDDCASHSNARCHWDGDRVRQARPLAPSLTLVHKLGFGEDPKKGKVVAWREWALYGKPILIKVSVGPSLPRGRGRTEARSMESYNWKESNNAEMKAFRLSRRWLGTLLLMRPCRL